MFKKSLTCSALLTLYVTVSTQSEINKAETLFDNSQRQKRWPEGYQSGTGPPIDQTHNFADQIHESTIVNNQNYNPYNYDETQSKRHIEIKREPQVPFDFIPNYATPVQSILKNIPGYSWVESNNPGKTYTHVVNDAQNPIRDIFNVVFGPEQTDRILQTGQPNFQTQIPQQNNYYYNSNDNTNRDYENNIYRQQTDEIQIQPSVTEVMGVNSENVYKTQYNTPYNNNQQQVFTSFNSQFDENKQPSVSAQSQPASSQSGYGQASAFASSSNYNNGYATQQSQQANPNQVQQIPVSSTQNQFGSVPFQNTYSTSVQSQSSRPSSSVQDNSQFQYTAPAQTTYIQSPSRKPAPNESKPQVINIPQQQNQNNQAELQHKQYQTVTTSKPVATRPPKIAAPKSTNQAATTKTNRKQTIQTTSSSPTTKRVINSNNTPYTNIKTELTTKRVQSIPQEIVTESRITSLPFATSPKQIVQNQVTENNIAGQQPTTQGQGVDFRKDALEVYGTMVQNVSYAALPNRTIQSTPVTEEAPKTTASTVKTESRFGFDSDSSNQIPTTKKPSKKCEAPPSPPVPNFAKPRRRISQTKCYEYIWEQQERVSKWNAKKDCHRAQNEMIYIAGREGMPALYPHMAALGWSGSNGSWLFKCAGALISPKYVLTAGHCSKIPPTDNSVLHPVPQIVRLGDRDLDAKVRTGTISVDVGIKSIRTHPEYAPPIQYNDIALVELERPITFTRHVQPACLWSNPDTSKLGNQFVATSWGVVDTAFQRSSPLELQKVAFSNIDSNTCMERIQPYCNRNRCAIVDHQICGANLNGSLNPCLGDSGAPLQAKIPLSSDSEGSMHYIIGVSSFKIGCDQGDVPTVFTRLSSFINWIENIVWMNS